MCRNTLIIRELRLGIQANRHVCAGIVSDISGKFAVSSISEGNQMLNLMSVEI